jgi:hypothetical protein
MTELYAVQLKEAYHEQTMSQRSNRRDVLRQLEEINVRLNNAKTLLVDNKIDADDFRDLKPVCTNRVNELETQLSANSQQEPKIEGILTKAFHNLTDLVFAGTLEQPLESEI